MPKTRTETLVDWLERVRPRVEGMKVHEIGIDRRQVLDRLATKLCLRMEGNALITFDLDTGDLHADLPKESAKAKRKKG